VQQTGGIPSNQFTGVSMLKINSFYNVNNLMRIVWEFYDDHVIIKTKSLTVDYENEVKYEKIKFI